MQEDSAVASALVSQRLYATSTYAVQALYCVRPQVCGGNWASQESLISEYVDPRNFFRFIGKILPISEHE